MLFDREKAIKLLIEHENIIHVDVVMQQLESQPELRLYYLHNIFYHSDTDYNNIAGLYHDDQVQLYAQYDVEHLYDFLEKSDAYNLDNALKICQEKKSVARNGLHIWSYRKCTGSFIINDRKG